MIKKCLQKKKSIKFTDLWSIENWVINQAQNPDIKSFEDFGHGSFMKFIITDRDLKDNLLSTLDIETGKTGSGHINFSKDDIYDFVQRCLAKTQNKVNKSHCLFK